MDALRAHILARVAFEDRGYATRCWVWQRHCNPKGYARAKLPPHYKTSKAVYRVSYELWVGPIPDGLHIDHLCRVPSCVNPAHLEPVTPAENTRRASIYRVHGPTKPCCKYGHTYTPETTRYTSRGSRFCGVCYPKRERQPATACPKGHVYSENEPPVSHGRRRCRVCHAESRARDRANRTRRMAAARGDRRGESCGEQRPEEVIARPHEARI